MPANHLKKLAKRCFTIRLAIDQVILKDGLRALIESDPGLCCVNDALGGDPDVTVIDLSDGSAVEKLHRHYSETDAQFVVLTEVVHWTTLEKLVKTGAQAVVAKQTDGRSFLDALRIVANGGRWLDPKVVEPRGPNAPSLIEQWACWETLTNRERDVAHLTIQGAQPHAIGLALGVSRHTVRSHQRNMFKKLNIHSRLELVRYWSTQL